MEERENREEREERDVIGRKKGPVLASVILAVLLLLFTRGKGFYFGRGEDAEDREDAPVPVQETGAEDSAEALEDVLADPGSYEGLIPEKVEILVDGELVCVNGWACRDQEELKEFLAAFGTGSREFEITSGKADPDTLQWVRDIFESLGISCTED